MKKYMLLPLALLSSCTLFNAPDRYPAQEAKMCPVSEKYQPAFNILENGNGKLKVQLNNFTKLFNLSGSYSVKVTFDDLVIQTRDGSGAFTNTTDINTFQVDKEPFNVEIPVTRSGIYKFALADSDEKVFWNQKVFSIDPEENQISKEERATLAQKFAPILEMSTGEETYPATLEYIFNKEDADPELNNEPFLITNKVTQSNLLSLFSRSHKFTVNVNYGDFDKVLPYYGHSESVLKSGLANDKLTRLRYRSGKNNLAVYYSIFEHRKTLHVTQDKRVKVVPMSTPYIYINYHFFYVYDTKNGSVEKPVAASHILDRESLTVVLNNSREPIFVIYGAHLATQLMAELDSKNNHVQSWNGGRVYLNRPEVPMENGRILAVAAKGSHGIYPVKGTYAVAIGKDMNLLKEPAGGGDKLYPDFETNAGQNLKYKLRPLGIENMTSNCNDGYSLLAYSGSTVDVLGPTNAAFPPYTDREGDYKNYTDPGIYMFDLKKSAAKQ